MVSLKDIEQGVKYSTDSINKSNVITGELAALAGQLLDMIAAFRGKRLAFQAGSIDKSGVN